MLIQHYQHRLAALKYLYDVVQMYRITMSIVGLSFDILYSSMLQYSIVTFTQKAS